MSLSIHSLFLCPDWQFITTVLIGEFRTGDRRAHDARRMIFTLTLTERTERLLFECRNSGTANPRLSEVRSERTIRIKMERIVGGLNILSNKYQ